MSYHTQRALQASADAAALAGAQEFPTDAGRGRGEAVLGLSARRTHEADVTVSRPRSDECITSIPGCDPVNAVVVVEKAPTKTFFAGVLGINAFNIKARRPPARRAA